MTKILKLGFAMGGGVSLGTFSGAALSEAIKQAVLRGGYKDSADTFHEYDDIEIDVFAGASAGSMSLAIMLRGLAYQTDEELQKAENILKKDKSFDYNSLSPKKKEQLKVAQVVQNLQEDIWINEINIDKLLGSGNPQQQAALTHEAGLLRRGALDDIARKYFSISGMYDNPDGFPRKKILADEVIFGSSLTNLTGLKYDSRVKEPIPPGSTKDIKKNLPNPLLGANDAYTSFCHKEFRVFHLFFGEQHTTEVEKTPEDFPGKWLRYHLGDTKPGYFSDLRKKSSWSRMVATSMACGAFPFAFEPVVLERFNFEFDQWPEALSPEVCKYATGRDPLTIGDKTFYSYPFSYVDGGTFNNEPVREAFRMAAFLDSEKDPDTFDRLIIYVDPSIGATTESFRLPIHQEYTVDEKKLLKRDLIRKATADRLLPHIGTMLGVLADEGRVNENDKIAYIDELFKKKRDYNQLLKTLINKSVIDATMVNATRDEIKKLIEFDKVNTLIPQGSITLKGELTRVAYADKTIYKDIEPYISVFVNNGADAVDAALLPLFLRALYAVFIDKLIDLTGKTKESKILAMAPMVPDPENNGEPKLTKLPGDYLQAFAGFTSAKPNVHAADLAKFCAGWQMSRFGLFDNNYVMPKQPKWTDADKADFKKDFKLKLLNIQDRVKNLVSNTSLIDVFPGIDQIAVGVISNMVNKALDKIELEDNPFASYVFMIPVTDKSFEIDGTDNFNDCAPVKVDGKLHLVTELSYYTKTKEWKGIHLQSGNIIIDKDGSLSTGNFCKIKLPLADKLLIADLMPNPVFVYKEAIDKKHKGKQLGLVADEWVLSPGVKRIDDTLL